MNNQSEKLRLIYIPFLVIALSVIVGYTYLNWFFMVHLQSLPIKEEFVSTLFPVIVSWIPVFIWLRPRIRLLKLKKIRNNDPRLLYQFVAVFAITAPTMIAQEYMVTATGKLTELNNISQIESHAPTKYYKLKDSYIDKKDMHTYTTWYVTGKSDEQLHLEVYVVCPVLPDKPSSYEHVGEDVNYSKPLLVIDGKPYPGIELSAVPKEKIISVNKLSEYEAFRNYGELAKNGAITLTTDHFIPELKVPATILKSILPDTVKCWLGIKYSSNISNNISSVRKDTLTNIFLRDSQRNFQIYDFSKIVYLKRLGLSDDIEDYQYAISRNPLIQSSRIIMLPVNEPFESRNGNKSDWIYVSFGIGALLWLIMILIPELEDKDLPVSESEKTWE